jgi:hypothetical protein
MSRQITYQHLNFLQEAKEAFERNGILETYWDKDAYDLIALRYGQDRDCVMIYELGDDIALFAQQTVPAPKPRKAVRLFSYEMESQLQLNAHKRGWDREHWEFLNKEINRNSHSLAVELFKEDRDKDEIIRRAANIANFAMMIADNYGSTKGGNE